MSWDSWLAAWNFYLPASAIPFGLYVLWMIFGQDSVLPLDLGRELGGRRLTGGGRGWHSLFASLVMAGLVGAQQGRGDEALVLGLGAHFGSTLNSIVKRARGIERGTPVPLADNIDFFLGASLFYALQFGLGFGLFVQGLIVCGSAHFILGGLIRSIFRHVEPPVQ